MPGLFRRLTTIADLELLVQVFKMGLYCFRGNKQALRYLLVLQSIYQQIENLELALGQRIGHQSANGFGLTRDGLGGACKLYPLRLEDTEQMADKIALLLPGGKTPE